VIRSPASGQNKRKHRFVDSGERIIVTKGRLEAFSDGVIAIVITIMVLELKVPAGHDWSDLGLHSPAVQSLSTYALSFVLLAIYWNNHHHLLHACPRVTAGILWANIHLLFWLSLVPFLTSWMEETSFAPVPTACYAILQLLCAIAYTVLQLTIIRAGGPDSKLARAVGNDLKGKVSVGLYLLSIPLALVKPAASGCWDKTADRLSCGSQKGRQASWGS
jgi:uncharacterized membrane protein